MEREDPPKRDDIIKALKAGDVACLKEWAEKWIDLKTFKCKWFPSHPGCLIPHVVAAGGNTEAMVYLAQSGVDVKGAQDDEGNTPVFYAALAGQLDVVKLLIEDDWGADVKYTNKAGDTLDFYAAIHLPDLAEPCWPPRDFAGTFKWLAAKTKSREHARTGKTLLHALVRTAAHHKYLKEKGVDVLDLIQWLVSERRMSLDAADTEGRTPLHDFLSEIPLDDSPRVQSRRPVAGAESVPALLLEMGASPDTVATDGTTLIHALLDRARGFLGPDTLDCLDVLIEACLEKDNRKVLVQRRAKDGATPLQLALEAWGPFATNAVGMLADAAGNLDPLDTNFDGNGGTVFHHVSSGHLVEYIAARMRPNEISDDVAHHTDHDGRTVLHAAARRFAHSAVTFFAASRRGRPQRLCHLYVNARDSGGATPLHLACGQCPDVSYAEDQRLTIAALLACGADPLAKDGDSATPLELLAIGGSPCAGHYIFELMHAAERWAAGTAGPSAAPLDEAAFEAQGDEWDDDWDPASLMQQPSPLAAAVAGLRHRRRLMDATLVCEGEEIAVHSLVLAAQSPFFESLLLGQFQRPDRKYPIEEMSAKTLRRVVDFAYTAELRYTCTKMPLTDLAALMRAADRFAMPRLLAVCRVRVTGTMQPKDNDLFAVYEAAAAIEDADTLAMIERFLLSEQCSNWLRALITDKEAWAGLCQPDSAANGLLQSLLLKALAGRDGASDGKKRKRGEEKGTGGR